MSMTTVLNEFLPGHSEQRRAFQRYAVSMSVRVQPATEADARRRAVVNAVVTNVSLSGLVFVSSRMHPPGSLVEIQIKIGTRVHSVQAVVKRNHLLVLVLPNRRVFQCAAQFVRGDSVARFIPALARHLYCRFGPNSSCKS